ncbi:MAG: hypothetical protein JSW60_03755 [Thermoplasmatales archaeon]|nr:MAG: hypothetical protein JSW60_03755 [Thermoplasmatales archaeon]
MCGVNAINLMDEQGQSGDFDYDKFFTSPSAIQNDFYKIWNKIIQRTGLDIRLCDNLEELKNLVVYDILDGNRSTLVSKSMFSNELECVFYVLNFIHTLKALGARYCYIMIHTSYNRERGKKEFNRILERISLGAPLIKKYAIQNNVRCSCICLTKNYEHIHLLNNIMDSTKNGDFHTYFLFDYNEKWITTKYARDIFNSLPDIDVHIRHTKFQVSGGWIPEKMSHSVFLYSQNGTIYSNWNSDELVTLVALALLAKQLHQGELLKKTYHTKEEIKKRYELRELDLLNKVIYLRESPKKLFIIGSPTGIYQFYY